MKHPVSGKQYSPKIGVILVNWNGGEFTIPCIESILASSMQPYEIVVVDNASTDGSAENISLKFPGVHLIRNTENLGFTGGNNIGIIYLLGKNMDYIWLLNNDTEISGFCLEYLLEELEDKPDIAAATGKILYPDRKTIWYGGSMVSSWTLSARHRGDLESDRGQYDQPGEVPFISGCCMMIRREVFENIGILDDIFFAYYEDLDWCIRARKAGFRLRYVPKAIIYHKVSASMKKHKEKVTGGSSSPFAIYLFSRNRLVIIRKHAAGPLRYFIAMACCFFLSIYYAFGLFILCRWDKFSALLRGNKDGLLIDIPSIHQRDKILVRQVR